MLWESLPSSVSVKIQELLSKNAGRRIWQIPVYQTVTKAHFDTPFGVLCGVWLCVAPKPPFTQGSLSKSCTYDKNGPVSKSQVRFTVLRTAPGIRRVFLSDFSRFPQPEGVSKRFRSGKTRQSTVTCYTLGMRVVGIWRFCRLLSVWGRPCGTPVYYPSAFTVDFR